MATYTVQGKVINQVQQPAPGLLVKAFDKDPNGPDNLLGKETTTDQNGEYRIVYADADFRINGKESGGADIVVHVYTPEGKELAQSPLLKNAKKISTVNLVVDYVVYPVVPKEERLMIAGQIVSTNGLPMVGVKIRALVPEIGASKAIQEAITNDKGVYQLAIHKDNKNIKLILGDDLKKPLLDSGLIPIKEEGNVFDLVIKPLETTTAKSEFEQIQEKIKPFIGKMAIADLKEDDAFTDLSLLAQKTGLDVFQLAVFVLAHRHAAEIEGNKISPELFYGLMRQGYIYEADTLLSFKKEELKTITEAAQKEQIIGANLFLTDLETLITQHNISKKEANAFSTVNDYLALAVADADTRIQVADLYARHQNNSEAFWKDLPQGVNVDKLRVNEGLSFLTLRNTPLVEKLHQDLSNNLTKPSDLLKHPAYELYTVAGWERILESIKVTEYPEILKGENNLDKAKNYATHLAEYVNIEFPMQVLAEKINRNVIPIKDSTVKTEIYHFLHKSDKFDLAKANVSDKKWQLSSAAQIELNRIRSLSYISLDDASLKALSDKNLENPLDVTLTSPKKLEDIVGEAEAPRVIARAKDATAAQALKIVVDKRNDNQLPVYALNGKPNESTNGETSRGLNDLLGGSSFDFCEIKECESLHGAPAYFVDLLDFMGGDKAQGTAEAKPFEEFSKRRPDLVELDLTCTNTDTLIPYIDIVNEILEYKVSKADNKLAKDAIKNMPVSLDDAAKKRIIASPQSPPNKSAYAKLKGERALYPFNLPFNYHLEVFRTYLNQLNLPYFDFLMMVKGKQTWGIDLEMDLLLEYLAISPDEYNLVFSKLKELNEEHLQKLHAGQSVGSRQRVDKFLEIFNITFSDLEEITQSVYLNPNQSIVRGFQISRLSKKLILRVINDETLTDKEQNILSGWFFNIGNFFQLNDSGADQLVDAKLWIKNNYPLLEKYITLFYEGDSGGLCKSENYTILYFDGTPLNNTDWARLYFLLRIWKKLGWTIGQTASLLNGIIPAKSLEFNTALTEISWAKQVGNYFKIAQDQGVDLLIDLINPIYSFKVWAKLLNIQEKELNAWLSIIDKNKAESFKEKPNYQDIWFFTQRIQAVRSSGFSIEDLEYLYQHKTVPRSKLILNEQELKKMMNSIKMGLKAVEKSIDAVTAKDDFEILRIQLGALYTADNVEIIMKQLQLSPITNAPSLSELFKLFSTDPAARSLVTRLSETAVENRPKVLIDNILPFVKARLKRSFIVETLSALFQIKAEVLQPLINDPKLLHAVSNPDQPIIENFDLTIETSSQFFQRAYIRVHKAALLCTQFKIFPEELAYLSGANNKGFNDLSFGEDQPLSFDNHWWLWFQYVHLRKTWTEDKLSLMPVLKAGDMDKARDAIKNWFDFPETSDLEKLISMVKFSPTSFNTEATLNTDVLRKTTHLFQLIELNVRHNLSKDYIESWSMDRSIIDETQTNEVIKFFDKNYDSETAKNNATKEIQDVLRKRKRDALVAYLIQNEDGITSANDLYTRLLIDVEMESCMKTSRLKMALSSAQLFIQRCLLGLETPEVLPTIMDGKRWKWMKNFRVWEANRKIFLYPENWLDPEFRHNQTEIFKEAESQLMQGDMNDEQIKLVFSDYIHNFEPLARLQPKALFIEDVGASGKIVHVIARTFAAPHKYYYRQLSIDYSPNSKEESHTWTAWKKIPIEMDGEHLMPVVWQGSLFIFWLNFIEKGENSETTNNASALPQVPTTIKKVEISLSYTENRGGKWLTRKTAKVNSREINRDIVIPNNFNKQEVFSKVVLKKLDKDQTAEDLSFEIGISGNSAPSREGKFQTTYQGIAFHLKSKNGNIVLEESKEFIERDLVGGIRLNNDYVQRMIVPGGANTIESFNIGFLETAAFESISNFWKSINDFNYSVAFDSRGGDYYYGNQKSYFMYQDAYNTYFVKVEGSGDQPASGGTLPETPIKGPNNEIGGHDDGPIFEVPGFTLPGFLGNGGNSPYAIQIAFPGLKNRFSKL